MEQPNLSYIHSMSGGDTSFEDKLIAIIKSELPVEKGEYLNTLKNENYTVAAGIVHKLKHKISILGLNRSYEMAERYEENLREGRSDLREEFENVLKIMTSFLETL